MKVLIVDDSFLIQERLLALISELPELEVIGQAYDAVEGVRLVQELKPDVLILDMRMPRGSGLDVLKKMKRQGVAATVIVYTNYPYPQYRAKCLALGATHFFDKAADFDKLMDTLTSLAAANALQSNRPKPGPPD